MNQCYRNKGFNAQNFCYYRRPVGGDNAENVDRCVIKHLIEWGRPMEKRAEAGDGFTVLDGVALVTGAAVALVHLRSSVTEFNDPSDWVWGCGLFTWLSVTSAGPFVYSVRRFFTRPAGYPRLGD